MELLKTSALIEAGIGHLHGGAQLYVWADGQAHDWAFGDMAPETRALWMSSVKPFTALAVARLVEAGKVAWQDPLAKHVPAFGANGKEAVTLWHVMTHTGGFRAPHASWKPAELGDIVERICAAGLEPGWVPGEKAGYHPDTSWYVLAELVLQVDGRPIDVVLREDIFAGFGMTNSFLGIPEHEQDERVGVVWSSHKGALRKKAPLNHPEVVALVRPGGNGRGPARELGHFYRSLLEGGGGVVGEAILAEMTKVRHREGMFDQTFQHIIDFGLGFMLNGNRYGADTVPYGFGRHAGENAFGHGGSQSTMAFADPDHGIAVALVFNGMPGELAHQQRMRSCLTALYEDLGLVAG